MEKISSPGNLIVEDEMERLHRKKVELAKWRVFSITFLCLFCLTTQSLGQTVKVTSSKANLRSGPGMEYQVIDKVAKGKTLDVVEKKGDWLKVRRKGQKEAWIHGKMVKGTSSLINRASLSRENLQKTPKGQEGLQPKKPKTLEKNLEREEVFVFRKVRLTKSFGRVKVTGEMANHSGQDFLATGFIISFFDVKKKPLGMGEILIDDFEKGETKSFTTYVEDVNYHSIHQYRIQFDFGI